MSEHYTSDPAKGCGLLIVAGAFTFVLVVIAIIVWAITR